jgi:hypothetical protein
LKHSITVTDYVVRVFAGEVPRVVSGKWVRMRDFDRVALTGLTRKILRKLKREHHEKAVLGWHYSRNNRVHHGHCQ